MTTIWLLILTFFRDLPWIAVALMAALALRRRKDSTALMLQALGAAASFILGIGQWVFVDLILKGLNASPTLLTASRNIFSFLLFIALATFALGYCAERFFPRPPAQVTVTPA